MIVSIIDHDDHNTKVSILQAPVSDQAPAAAADLTSEVTKNMATMVCSIQNRDECMSCGS